MNRDAIAEPRSPDDGPAPPSAGEIHVWRVKIGADHSRDAGGDPRAAARAALAELLAAYLGGPAEAELTLAEGGKPRLARAPERLSFNLSHSGSLALIAIAAGGVEVGIDLERLRPRRDLVRLAQRWLPADDATAVAAAPPAERERAFYAVWTRHEARAKCTGAGLAGPPPGPEIVAYQLEIDDGYAAAVAVRTDAGPPGAADPAASAPRILLRDGPYRR